MEGRPTGRFAEKSPLYEDGISRWPTGGQTSVDDLRRIADDVADRMAELTHLGAKLGLPATKLRFRRYPHCRYISVMLILLVLW